MFECINPLGFAVSTDPAKLDVALIHCYLAEQSYWAANIPLDIVQRSLANSLNFGLFAPSGQQVGFARMVTDKATFAWLCDVFVLPEFRGRGLSKWLLQCLLKHPDLQGLRRYMLGTRDAHGLYHQFGFAPLSAPERFLQNLHPSPYRQ